jgi:2-phosphosulfolactate phosphatase
LENQPKINFVSLDQCAQARGVVVAIDVVRAFTTAAFAFAAGAERILLAGTVEEALALRERFPGALLMGEVGGKPVAGFDLWNSPAQFAGLDLRGRTLVQRTSAGTQGVVRCPSAGHIFASSFVVAGATVQAIRRLEPDEVTFVITGQPHQEARSGKEDADCARYMQALLQGRQPVQKDYLSWADTFLAERLDDAPEEMRLAFSGDLELCKQVDRFDFYLPVRRADGLFILERQA